MSGFVFSIRCINEVPQSGLKPKDCSKLINDFFLNPIQEGDVPLDNFKVNFQKENHLNLSTIRRSKMAKFMYLFRSHPTSQSPQSPEQMEQSMKKYMEWKETLEKNGHLIDFGARLDGTGKVVRDHGNVVTDGPYVEAKDYIQGYMFLEAENMEQAVELVKDSPMMASNGTLEIRPVMSM